MNQHLFRWSDAPARVPVSPERAAVSTCVAAEEQAAFSDTWAALTHLNIVGEARLYSMAFAGLHAPAPWTFETLFRLAMAEVSRLRRVSR